MRDLYLFLMHGRNSPEEELSDWGFDGPLLGPLRWAHFTYGELANIGIPGLNGPDDELDLDLFEPGIGGAPIVDSLFHYDGKCYGDWELVSLSADGARRRGAIPFDPEKLGYKKPAPVSVPRHEDEGG